MILSEAVRRMLPKNKLAVKMLSKLKIYAGGRASAPGPNARAQRIQVEMNCHGRRRRFARHTSHHP